VHQMLSTEKNRLKEQNSDLMEFYDFFSNRNVHPIRTESIENNRSYQKNEDKQLLDWQLDIIWSLIIQMVKIYSDTMDYRYVVSELEPVDDAIAESRSEPKFLNYFTEDLP